MRRPLALFLVFALLTASPPAVAQTAPQAHKNYLAPPSPLWPLFVMGGVMVGGIVTSIVAARLSDADQITRDSTNFAIIMKVGVNGCSPPSASVADLCKTLKSNQDTVDTDNMLIVIGGVVTGVAAAAGLLYYFLGPGKPDKPAWQKAAVVPWFAVSGSGLAVSGRF